MSSKLQNLTATTTADPTDIVYIVVDPAGTPLDRKITKQNLSNNKVQALSDGANIAIDFENGYDSTVTVAGDRTMDAPTNIKAGGSGVFTITCDTTARTITWASAYRLNGSASPVTAFAASSVNKVFWHSADGTNVDIDVIYGV